MCLFPLKRFKISFLNKVTLSLYPRKALAEDAGISPEGNGFTGITFAQNVGSSAQVTALIQRAVEAWSNLDNRYSVAVSQVVLQTQMGICKRLPAIQKHPQNDLASY